MRSEEIKAVFDSQAAGYDKQWARMAPVREGLYFLLDAVFSGLPEDARILCVGAGTGIEMAYLAKAFPGWRFTAVEPSGPMLEVCRQRASDEGFASRCDFHEGYLDSLPAGEPYHGATCFLVSQFILEREARIAFFRGIADRLVAGGVLASSDLAADVHADTYQDLLRVWIQLMSSSGVQADVLERTRAAYAKDVGILPPADIAALITAAGFASSIQFYQSGLMHAWYSRRAANGR